MSNMASDAKVSFSSTVGYRAVIWYLYSKGKQVRKYIAINVYGSSAHRMHKLNSGLGNSTSRTFLEDETRSGRPSDAPDEEIFKKSTGSGVL